MIHIKNSNSIFCNHLKSEGILLIAILLLLICLAVFQDYLYSQLRNTGFYLSESLLYNSIWLFFVPLGTLQLWVLKNVTSFKKVYRILFISIIGLVFSLLHLLLFSLTFVGISAMVFSPGHRFYPIFKSALSNHFYLLYLIHLAIPFVDHYLRNSENKTDQEGKKEAQQIKVTVGTKSILINTDTVQSISSDRPYTSVTTDKERFLDSRSLKEFENLLNPSVFIRVHRSNIINQNYIKELQSRKNGDYDVLLQNGTIIRLSRHYRKNWEYLLH
ncbi:MAG: LytTR family DNA-binding domain-containing protein [Bacteroidota bacterium]